MLNFAVCGKYNFCDFVQLCYGFITILFRLYIHQSFKVINVVARQIYTGNLCWQLSEVENRSIPVIGEFYIF